MDAIQRQKHSSKQLLIPLFTSRHCPDFTFILRSRFSKRKINKQHLSKKIIIILHSRHPYTADHPPVHQLTFNPTVIMTMTLDQRSHHLGGLHFDHLPYANSPQFSNPWVSSQSATHAPQLFPNSMVSNGPAFDALKQQPSVRSTTSSVPYSSAPTPATSMPATSGYSSYASSNLLDLSQDLLKPEFPRSPYEQGYSAAPSSLNSYAPTSAPYVSSYSTLAQPHQPDEIRRLSHS